MLRIISGLLLLIISQISIASLSQSLSTVPAVKITALWHVSSPYFGAGSTDVVTACKQYNGVHSGYTYTYVSNNGSQCIYDLGGFTSVQSLYSVTLSPPLYSCSSGYLSDSAGVASSSGQFCTTSSSVDSCTSYAGQSGYFWVSKKSAPSTVCSGTCLATISGTWGDSPDVDPAAYTQHQYTYTGATGECTSDSGFTDAATAAESNAAVAEKERLAKVQKAIDDAITACGGVGFYTSGTFNGETVIACTNQDKKTETTTTTTTSGATTTTANTSTTTNNNGQTTTVKPDGTSTTTGGTTTSSGKTSTSTTTTNPDGSTTTTTTASGATGTCSESDMKGTVGCADMGEIPDTADVPSDEEDSGLGSYTPWGSSSSACPAPPIVNGHIIDNSDQCSFFSKLKPFIIAAGFLIAVYISLGIRSSGGD